MNTFSHVWVFSDTPSRLPELMSGALASGEQIHTFVQHDAEGETARRWGRIISGIYAVNRTTAWWKITPG